jgi:hypothetical protein
VVKYVKVNVIIRDGDMEILASVTGVVATNLAHAKKWYCTDRYNA